MRLVQPTALRVETTPAIDRRPVYFGPADRRLFGWYHAPERTTSPAAVVICPPLGHEYTNTHRSIRHLADRLACAGVPALRFDYDGTGDSSGSDRDPDRLAAWIGSISEAARALRLQSGCDAIGLAGLRMGATLAALASHEVNPACLVLWAPCVRGRAYLRELKALQLVSGRGPRAGRHASELDAGGFVVTDETQTALAALDLEEQPPRARRVLIGARSDVPEGPRLRDRWTSAGLIVDRRELPGYADMMLVPHNTTVPAAALTEIVSWIVNTSAREAGSRRHSRAISRIGGLETSALSSTLRADGTQESTIRFGPAGANFAIVTEPVARVDRRLPTILLSNAGATHHVGPNRLHVLIARRLAQAGFRCVRLDLPGLGDSVVGDAKPENVPYTLDANATLAAAIEVVVPRSSGGALVMGLCSGAHAAFHAAVELDASPIVEALLINPLTFRYRPGMSLDGPPSAHVTRWQRYRRSVGSLKGWTKLFRADTDLPGIARDVIERAGIVARRFVRAMRPVPPPGPGATTELERDLQRLADRRRKLTFIFSRFDPGYDLLKIDAGRLVKSLRRQGQVQIAVIKHANHTFDQSRPRSELIDVVLRFLKKRYQA